MHCRDPQAHSPFPWIFLCGLDVKKWSRNREQEDPRLVQVVLSPIECPSLHPVIWLLKAFLTASLLLLSKGHRIPGPSPYPQFTLHTNIQHPGLPHKQMSKHLLTLDLLCKRPPHDPVRQTSLGERFIYIAAKSNMPNSATSLFKVCPPGAIKL